jgi:hypothetical protein
MKWVNELRWNFEQKVAVRVNNGELKVSGKWYDDELDV